MLQPSSLPFSLVRQPSASDIKIASGDASQAAQQAAAYCRDLNDALGKAEYRRFEQIAKDLMALAQARLAERDSAQRVENPMAVVDALIGLLEKNAQLQQANPATKLSLTRALHVYLDLMIIENYEQSDAKIVPILEETKKRYLKVISDFRDLCSPHAWDIRYELDCCYENIKTLKDNHSLFSELKKLLMLAATKDIGGLVDLAMELCGKMNKSWQVDVLLIRRLTPLAQQYPKILTLLQELMAGLRKADSYQVAYAMQEALHTVMTESIGADKALLQQQAMGLGNSKEQERIALTLQYYEGRHASHGRFGHKDSAVYKSDAHRYRFVCAVKELCLYPGEDKEASALREQSLQMLVRLSFSEPAKLSASRQWITEALAVVLKEKPDFKPAQAIQAVKDQQAAEQKALSRTQAQLTDEQKKLAEEKQSAVAKCDAEQKADIDRREQALHIKQKDVEAAQEELQRREKKLEHDSERLNELEHEKSDYALALKVWADELAKQAEKQALLDHPEIAGRSPRKTPEDKLIWAAYQLPSSYPSDYPAVIEALDKEGEFKQELKRADYCPFLHRPLYDAVALMREMHDLDGFVSDEAAQQYYSQQQEHKGITGATITHILPALAKDKRESITERIHPKVAQRYYELGQQALDSKDYHRWAECWRGALAMMPVDHQDGEARKALAKKISEYLQGNATLLAPVIVQTGSLFALEWLVIETSFDLRTPDARGNSLLMQALQHRQPAIARWLLSQAASKALVSLANKDGECPLQIAAQHGSDVGLLELLLEEKAGNINKVNQKGETALHYAAAGNQVTVMHWLLEHGASLGVKDKQNNTPLHAAAQAGAKEAFVWLLQNGLSHHIRNKAGQTPRQVAEEYKQTTLIVQHDQVVAELVEKEEMVLRKDQSAFGLMFLKMQQIIQNQQEHITALQLENKSLRQEIQGLRDQEIKKLSSWRAELFTPHLERRLMDIRQEEIKREEEKLRLELVTACEQGDIKVVQLVIKNGAKPFYPDLEAKQKQPLGAAVWGMNPEVVNELLKEMKGVSSMTWEDCEKHNLAHYKEVFIVPKFVPETFDEWYKLLQKMDPSPFIQAYHLSKVNEVEPYDSRWESLNVRVTKSQQKELRTNKKGGSYQLGSDAAIIFRTTERGFVSLRTQIKQGIETAARQRVLESAAPVSLIPVANPAQNPAPSTLPNPIASPSAPISQNQQILIPPPKVALTPTQLQLQNQLITACEQGDEKAVKKLLKQGAKPDAANTAGKQPLGAAVWGMNPEVVNQLLTEMKGISPMTWDACETHNKKHYNNEVFIVPKFAPQIFEEWCELLQKMDPNPFIQAYHLSKVSEAWNIQYSRRWEILKGQVRARQGEIAAISSHQGRLVVVVEETEKGFVSFRNQIKQGIETAAKPRAGKTL